jgi:hypothetical protein
LCNPALGAIANRRNIGVELEARSNPLIRLQTHFDHPEIRLGTHDPLSDLPSSGSALAEYAMQHHLHQVLAVLRRWQGLSQGNNGAKDDAVPLTQGLR